MNDKPTATEGCHPDVLDATQALQGLLQLGLRRLAAVMGGEAAQQAFAAICNGKADVQFTVSATGGSCHVAGVINRGGELVPILNFNIDQLSLACNDGSPRVH